MRKRTLGGRVVLFLLVLAAADAAAQKVNDPPVDQAGANTSADSSDTAATASGNGWIKSMLPAFNLSFNGFVRPEVAIHTRMMDDPDNQRGNPYNNFAVTREAGDPATGFTTKSGLTDSVTRPVPGSRNLFDYHVLRTEVEMSMKLTPSMTLTARVRTLSDFGDYSAFNGASLASLQGGIKGGLPELYGGAPNLFQYHVDGSKHPNPLEWAGPNYLIYLPALILDYNRGPLDIRVGNQQIAWGQAIFFRVLDVPDGLDLRRHSILDFASEEFSDKRVPSPAIRVNYQFNDAILADAFVQKFQPTVLGNPNTSYNIIPSQFTVHDLYHENGDDKWNKLSYGLRVRGTFGQLGFQAIAVRRYNPDGVFRWTASNVNYNLPVDNPLGVAENGLNTGTAPNPLFPTLPPQTTGQLLADSAFEVAPGGVYSADEWFHYAARARLNGISGLNTAISEFPSTAPLLASQVGNYDSAHNELDTFFLASGGSLRGHIAREYLIENNFGGGVSYVTQGEPGSVLDQLIINLETTYTPNRRFTNPTLSRNYLRQDNVVSALVLEKYQRFSRDVPATYMVFQYMHRTKDDIVGRSLRGYGGKDRYDPDTTSAAPGVKGGSNYIVFAAQQPFASLIWRADFAALYDVRGGLLLQPAVRWKPNTAITVEAFYNYLNGRIGGNPNNNVVSTLDFANEATVRFGYQF